MFVVLVIQLGPLAPVADAQYFGRNKVQYKTFDFKILKTDHFDVYYYADEAVAAAQAARMAERWYTRLSRIFQHELTGRQPLILYASHPDFEQTNVIQGDLGEGTGGVTEALKRRIVLPLSGPLADTDHVIGHELVHAFQYDITRQGLSSFAEPGAARLPLWFIEGMAEYLSIGPRDPNTALWIRDAANVNRLPKVRRLGDPRFFPYRYGQAFWAYIGAKYGDDVIGEALKSGGRNGDAALTLARVIGVGPDTVSAEWHDAIRAWYEPIAAATVTAQSIYKQLIAGKTDQASLNIAPALSPDGKRVMFFSERSLFSIELYLADAHSGKILRRITDTAVDPHYQSLQFIQSAGAWSPDGKRFAFGAVADGVPMVTVIDPNNGHKMQEIHYPDLGEIFTPSWSPDGHQIVFSALVGGTFDLFVVDLRTRETRRLTNNLYAEMQPAWSPDGKRIAFVTDQFTTNLDTLSYGHERLASIDPESGAVTELTGFDDGKSINPQWTPDGRSLYFISDHHGIPNLYRTDAVSGATPRQITNLRTGVSGITRLSPALTAARDADHVVFSVFEDGSYSLYSIDSAQLLEGRETLPAIAGVDPGTLPPSERKESKVEELAKQPSLGLLQETGFERKPYRARLGLDYIAQTSAGVSFGSNGTAFGGGTTLYWSDMLSYHNLATLFQFTNNGGSFINNVATVVAYDNRHTRFNWGVGGGQVPYLTRIIETRDGILDGAPVVVQNDFRYWEIDREVQGNVAYPFSRVRRLEFSLGYRNISYTSEVEQFVYDANTGTLIDHTTTELPDQTFQGLNLFTGMAAYVHDNSIFGGTSPVVGSRTRLEFSPVAGDLNYYGALADLRYYLMPVRPITFAVRGLHYGRYGKGGEDPRLTDLYVGSSWLVHGYDSGSFDLVECGDPNGDCPTYDRLFGSRIAVANAELRFPLLGALGLLRTPAIPPVEMAAFYDAGVAWTSDVSPTIHGGGKEPVTSWGGALRVNLLGFAVGELALVHPNDRPLKGWYWQFSLEPGF